MVRSRIQNNGEQIAEIQPSSQSSVQENMVDMFQEVLRLLNSSSLRSKNARWVKKQLMKYAPDGYKQEVKASKKQITTPKFKGSARKAANTMMNAPTKKLKKDSPFKSSYAGRSCPTMPNSKKPSVAKSMYGAISNDSLALSIPPTPIK